MENKLQEEGRKEGRRAFQLYAPRVIFHRPQCKQREGERERADCAVCPLKSAGFPEIGCENSPAFQSQLRGKHYHNIQDEKGNKGYPSAQGVRFYSEYLGLTCVPPIELRQKAKNAPANKINKVRTLRRQILLGGRESQGLIFQLLKKRDFEANMDSK